jgi:hypothetical protein
LPENAPPPGDAAVGVDDDLAAGQARVAIGATDFEAAGRVDVVDGLVREQLGRDHLGHGLLHPRAQSGRRRTFVVTQLVLIETTIAVAATWRAP